MIEKCNFKEVVNGHAWCHLSDDKRKGFMTFPDEEHMRWEFESDCPGEEKCIIYQIYKKLMENAKENI